MLQWLFSSNTKYRSFLYLIFALFPVLVGIFLTFSLFPDILKLSLITSFQDGVLTIFVPIMISSNADSDKSKILSDNKGKAGIYQWTHIESGKMYIGSAVNLSRRLKNYLNVKYLNRSKYMHISKALLYHGYSSFSLTIFELIDVQNLSKLEAKKLLLEKEQFYIDTLLPEYNILRIAGSSLGYTHSEESIVKMSNKTFSAETKGKMSLAKLGDNHPMFGLTHSEKTKTLMSLALSGQNHPFYGKNHSDESKNKISISNGTPIFVYRSEGLTYINSFPSAIKAGEHFNVSYHTILKYSKSGKLFKNEWILSTSKD
jgi:group I intron endonuclease